MALWCCNACSTLYAVELYGGCPHCRHPDFHEFGTWPEDEEHPMSPKIRAVGTAEPVDAGGESQVVEEPAAPPVATIAKILDEVGDDPDKALAALEAEQARGDDARSTLVDKLTKIVDAATEDATSDVDEDDSEE